MYFSSGQTRHSWKWNFKLNLTIKININKSPKQKGCEPRCFAPLVHIWWSWLEWVTSYQADKLRLTHTHAQTYTHTHTKKTPDRCNENTQRPKLSLGKNEFMNWLKCFENSFSLIMVVMIRSSHDFVHVMTDQLWWHLQNLRKKKYMACVHTRIHLSKYFIYC